MRTTNPFHDGAEEMAKDFQRLAAERASQFSEDEDTAESDEE